MFAVFVILIQMEINIFFEGIWKGKIALKELGENGFGYDSIFIPNGEEITSAQMSSEEKNNKSHRAIALKKLINLLENK